MKHYLILYPDKTWGVRDVQPHQKIELMPDVKYSKRITKKERQQIINLNQK